MAPQWRASPNIGRVIKSRRLSWVGHKFRMEEFMSDFKHLTYKITKKKKPLIRPGVRFEEILESELKNRYHYGELGWFGSRYNLL